MDFLVSEYSDNQRAIMLSDILTVQMESTKLCIRLVDNVHDYLDLFLIQKN
jgi:hypothetical protein